MVSCPLLTPQTFLRAATPFGRAAKRGLRGLGSVRRADFGTLSDPEVSLRDLPRITVRGQTVQGVRLLLRKAPLRSSVDPWSTKRPCGPLAFKRATEGSRVRRRVGGVKRGQGNHTVPLPPFVSAGRPRQSLRRETPAISPPGDPGKTVQSYNFVTLQSLSVTQKTDRAPAVPARTYRSRGGTRPP